MEITIEVEPVHSKSGLFIPFPEELAKLLEYVKGDHLVFIADGERMLIQNKRNRESNLCDNCHESKKKHTCISCKKVVCVNCFWPIGGLCKQCIKNKGKRDPE
jgi:hypothetical protein